MCLCLCVCSCVYVRESLYIVRDNVLVCVIEEENEKVFLLLILDELAISESKKMIF